MNADLARLAFAVAAARMCNVSECRMLVSVEFSFDII